MPKYIKKKDLKNAIDECTWYHIGKNGELVEGANSSEHEPLYKYSDIKEIIKNLPTRKFENEPKCTALSKALKWTYGDEPNSSEFPNNSTISKMEQVDEPTTQTETQNSNLTFEKDECAKEYEELGLKELKELIEADRKTEPFDKDINVRSKTEPQTNADQHVQHVESVESVEPTWTTEEHEAFYTFLWNVINPNEMQEYIGMFETKDEPQTDCAWK